MPTQSCFAPLTHSTSSPIMHHRPLVKTTNVTSLYGKHGKMKIQPLHPQQLLEVHNPRIIIPQQHKTLPK